MDGWMYGGEDSRMSKYIRRCIGYRTSYIVEIDIYLDRCIDE